MTWKEYKDMRLTAQERSVLTNYIEEISRSVNDKKMPCRASGTLKTLIAKLIEDERDYMIAGMLRTLAALDGVKVER